MALVKTNNDFELRSLLLDEELGGHPILVLVRRFATPQALYDVLRAPTELRNRYLRSLVNEIVVFLRAGVAAFRGRLDEILRGQENWENLRPVLRLADVTFRNDVGAAFAESEPLKELAEELFPELTERWGALENVRVLVLAAGLVVTAVSGGLASPLVAGVVGAVMLGIQTGVEYGFAASAETQRNLMNRTALVDEGLRVAEGPASGEMVDITADVGLLAASILLPAMLGPVARRFLRTEFTQRVLLRAARGRTPRPSLQGLRTAERAVDRPIPGTGEARLQRPAGVGDEPRLGARPAAPSEALPSTGSRTAERQESPMTAGSRERRPRRPASQGNTDRPASGAAETRQARPIAGAVDPSTHGPSARAADTMVSGRRSEREPTQRPPRGRSEARRQRAASGREQASPDPAASGRGPRLRSTNVALSGDTAGTGLIKEIWAHRDPDGTIKFRIEGELGPSLGDRRDPRVPNFNVDLPTSREIGLPDYERAHLWGPGFGDEAREGIMYAPREVNQVFQSRTAEARLRELRDLASNEGATIVLTASAESYPRATWRGHELLKEVSYEFRVRYSDGSTATIGRIDISVPPPGSTTGPMIDVSGGAIEVWSLR
ncbi:MAG: polymorphic toxin type 4 domain-containing protein [Candidatus Polarisedimenticolia bacterium]